ncbi:MAG TPA: glycosyltransferase family 9 protein [Solirubrobacterales bacterium]|nr:glycosyltransferase family 9 protein [Solirubrobacterales bacterium]
MAVAHRRPAGAPPFLIVLRALGLGDLLTAVPALRGLTRAFPGHRRLLAAPRWLEPLLPLIREGGRPCLHGLVEADGLGADPASLPRQPDVAVNLHGRGPESHRLLLATEPSRLLAFRNDGVKETAAMPAWDAGEHETRRWCRLLHHWGIDADPGELAIEPPDVELPDWARGATLVHPGAASAARRWPPDRWAAIARAEREAGREVLVTGSRREVGLARSIAAVAGLDPRREVAGRTDLRGLAALVAAAGTVVCGDTGVAHLATALGVPSVLLFGPTSPRLWGPPEDRPIHRVLWEGGSGDPHGETVDHGLLEIEPDEVLAALESLRLEAVAR